MFFFIFYNVFVSLLKTIFSFNHHEPDGFNNTNDPYNLDMPMDAIEDSDFNDLSNYVNWTQNGPFEWRSRYTLIRIRNKKRVLSSERRSYFTFFLRYYIIFFSIKSYLIFNFYQIYIERQFFYRATELSSIFSIKISQELQAIF